MLESVSVSAEVTLPQVPCSTTLSPPTAPPPLVSSPPTSTSSSTSTTILPPSINLRSEIDHAPGKARLHFMNRPNVQNGLTSSSFKNGSGHPYPLQQRNNNPNPSPPQSNGSNNNNNSKTAPISLPPASAPAHFHHQDFGRPPFITTVTRGRFLPSKFDLLVEKHLYTFSSRPRPVGLVSKHQCSLYGSATGGTRMGPPQHHRPDQQISATPRGIHDYYNLMWDPHVRRGNPSGGKLFQPEEIVEEKKARISQASGGRTKRSTASLTNASSTGTIHAKKKHVRIGTPPPVKGRFHSTVQTEVFLEDLTKSSQVLEVDKVVQTDFLHPDAAPPFSVTLKTGTDASTEILPGELINFDEQVQPLVSVLVAKVLEQAFLETMEEEELAALREQQNRFQERKREEERQLRLLQEQHNRISVEKEILKKHLTEQRIIGEESMTRNGNSNGNGSVYSTSYLLELLPSVLNSLRQEGFLSDTLGNELFSPNSSIHPPLDVKPGGNGSSEEIQENKDSPDIGKETADTTEDSKHEGEPWSALENLEKELIETDSLES